MWDSSFIWNELEIKKLENKRAEKKCTATDARYFQIAEFIVYGIGSSTWKTKRGNMQNDY